MTEPRQPWFWARLLELVADPETRDAQLGDLAEEFEERAIRDPRAAIAWYRRQVGSSIGPNLTRRAHRALRVVTNRTGEGRMKTLWHDLRLAMRGARKNFAFSVVIVGTLALGIGANTTIFSIVYGLVLDPFPFPEPDRIVGVGTAYPRLGSSLGYFENLSPAEYLDIRDNASTLEDVVAWDMGNRQIDTDGPPENIFSAFWWGDALGTLEMDALLGRGFAADEVTTGANVILIGEDLWTTRFGADSTLIGQSLSVNGQPYTLIGVFPAGVDLYGTELWMTMPVGPEVYDRNRRQFQVMGRIVEGSTLGAVNAELEGLARRVEQAHVAEFEEYEGWRMQASTWSDVNSQFFRTGVWVLLGAVGFVLLLVCANTANLLLARARGRRREMALRTALGASRGRIVGQLLTESVSLSLLGGAAGIGLAWLGVQGVGAFLTTVGLNLAGTVALNGPVLAFTAVVSIASGILFGIAPALQASQIGIAAALKADGNGATATGSRQTLQRSLVAIEVALAFVLLAGGGLLVNSFLRVGQVDPGFAMDNVLTMRLTLSRDRYPGGAGPAFFRQLTERLEQLPGIEQAGAGTQFPPVAFAFRQIFFDGPEADAEATLPTTLTTIVTPGYFETLGVPLLRGRDFDDRDAEGSPLAAVVNQEVVDRFFPGQDPIGRRLKLGEAGADVPWWEIVGVVGATRNLGLDQDPFPEVFAVHEQVGGAQNQLFLVLRTRDEPAGMLPAVRQAILEMDPEQPVYAVRTIEQTYNQGIAPMRATTLLLSVFAAFALVMAAVGIYSIVSFTVGERTQEIGVRVALGADAGRVRGLVVRQALLPVLIGAAIGLGLALAVSGALSRMLFEVTGSDPLTLGSVAVLLILVAAAASWVPAYRAARMDPVEALRSD